MWAYEQTEGVTPHDISNAAIGLRGRRLDTPIGSFRSTFPQTPSLPQTGSSYDTSFLVPTSIYM